MIFKSYNTMPVLCGGFLFAFASKCTPTFFSLFLADQGYSTIDIILVSTLFFLGAILVSPDIFKKTSSNKVFQIAAAIGSTILHVQTHIYFLYGWFFIRFLQGLIDVFCRNSLNNLVQDRHLLVLNFAMNIGSSMGFLLMCFPGIYNLLFTITGVLLNLSFIAILLHKEPREYHRVLEIKKEKTFNNWYVILRANSLLFLGIILTTFFTTTLSTILPITLRNNGFINSDILRIMFVGSLGIAIIQMFGSFLRSMLGIRNFFRLLLISLPFFYLACLLSLYYKSLLISIFIFFIFGFHNMINGTVASIFREEEGVSARMSRSGINQINNIGAILSSIIAIAFLTLSPHYGLFMLWFLSIFLIWFVIHSFKSIQKY